MNIFQNGHPVLVGLKGGKRKRGREGTATPYTVASRLWGRITARRKKKRGKKRSAGQTLRVSLLALSWQGKGREGERWSCSWESDGVRERGKKKKRARPYSIQTAGGGRRKKRAD